MLSKTLLITFGNYEIPQSAILILQNIGSEILYTVQLVSRKTGLTTLETFLVSLKMHLVSLENH